MIALMSKLFLNKCLKGLLTQKKITIPTSHHIQSHLNLLTSPFRCSIWTSADRLQHWCLNALSCRSVTGWLRGCVNKEPLEHLALMKPRVSVAWQSKPQINPTLVKIPTSSLVVLPRLAVIPLVPSLESAFHLFQVSPSSVHCAQPSSSAHSQCRRSVGDRNSEWCSVKNRHFMCKQGSSFVFSCQSPTL